MKLIAVNTIHGRKVTRARDARNAKDRGESRDVLVKPGEEFDTAELGIADDDAHGLVASGCARRKMREVTDADEAGAGGAPAA